MNIYVSNLNFNTSEEQLVGLFSKFGNVVSANIITDRETNKSRGFAFVEMPSDEEGKAALSALNNKELEGRMLSVSVSKQNEKRKPRFF